MITADKLFVEKLNILIDDNLDNPGFSVDTICQTLGISRSHLHRILKEQTDLSTSLYVRKRRLQKARLLLTTTDWRISEVGDVVGITNPQNFSTYFIEEFGVSPTVFRKLQNQLPALTEPMPSPGALSAAVAIPVLSCGSSVDSEPNRPQPWWERWWIYAGIIAGLLLVLGAGLYSWQHSRQANAPVTLVGNSLAVLPFVNLGAADNGPACEGIMDDVHRSVSRIKDLKVIARSSADQYKGTQKSLRQIGNELQVSTLLKGSMLKTNNQIRVKVELINTQDDTLLWGHTYSAAYRDVFSLTNQIVQDVARQLKLQTRVLASGKVALARPQNLEAYNAFLQGRQLVVTRTKANLLESIVRFDRALALDSTFAEAYACKAEVYVILPNLGYVDADEAHRLVERNALMAVRLDPTNSTAHAVLGNLYHDTYQWQAAENAFRIALQYNPNHAQANYWYSLLLRSLGRLDEAIRYSTQAVALDPLYPVVLAGHIVNCSLANRFALARAGIESGRALFDQSFIYHTGQGFYRICRRDYGGAVTELRKGLALNPDYQRPASMLMYCEAKRGNRQEATAFLRILADNAPRTNYERAVVYAGLDQADSCLYYLRKAADAGYIHRDMGVSPLFKPYRSHPIFNAILRQYHLPHR